MTIQYINTGTGPNAGNGDSLRVAFSKINANFSSLAGSSSVDFPSQTGHAGQFLTTDGGALSWAAVSGAGGLSTATVIVSNVAPRNPVLGELWYDDVSGRLYVWYDTFWVDASPRGNANVSTLVNGTYTFALTTSGSVVLNGSAFTGGGATDRLTSSTAVLSLSADGSLTLPNGAAISSTIIGFHQTFPTNGAGGNSSNNNSLAVGIPNPAWAAAILANPSNYYIQFAFDDYNSQHPISGISGPQGGTNIYTLTGSWTADGGAFPITISSNDYADGVTTLSSISGAQIATAGGSWLFGQDGVLTMPDGNNGGNGAINFTWEGNNWASISSSESTLNLYSLDVVSGNPKTNVRIGANVELTTNLLDSAYTWTFGLDGNLTIPVTGDITRDGVSAFAIGDSDGGVADNSAGITITTYTLSTSQYDTSGSVTYNIASAGASAAGIIIKGLTVDYTQVIDGSFDQGSNTISWNDYTISGNLWQQVASVTAFVTDSRGYTFYALVTDAWEVPHGPCLVEGTLITMADGTHRAIEDIAHGELIRVWNFDLGEFGEAQPIWIKAAEETDMHNFYTFSDGTELRTVGHHVFNKEAGAFTKFIEDTTPVGTTTFNEYGQEVTLVSKERVVAPTRYYNVWTQYHLNLFANGILTSNRFNNIYPIVDMKFVKDDRVLRSVDEFRGIDEKYINGLRLREQPEEYTAEYIADYVHNRLERLDIANQVEQGI